MLGLLFRTKVTAVGWALVAAWMVLTFASAAVGQEADPVSELMGEIEEEIAQLDTSDCTAACAALESMRRAAQRVCELDAGERCAKARARVEEARKKVLAACPDCQAAQSTANFEQPFPAPDAEPKPADRPEPPVQPGVDQPEQSVTQGGVAGPAPAPAAPPRADEADGGCAACAVGHRDPARDGVWLVLMAGALALARRRLQSD